MAGKNVYLVDDDPAVLRSTSAFLEVEGYAVRTFGSANAFLAAMEEGAGGCVISDIRMPGLSGLELQERISERYPSLALILVSGHADVPTAVQAMQRGAFDLIEKPFDPEQLIESVERAFEGLAEAETEAAAGQGSGELPEEAKAKLELLTAREREIFDHVVRGKTNKAIAFDLELSQRTVEAHRANIKKKLGANGLADLISLVQPK